MDPSPSDTATRDAADDKQQQQTKTDTAAPPETVYTRDKDTKSLTLSASAGVEGGSRRPFTYGLNSADDLRKAQRTPRGRNTPPEVPPKPSYLSGKPASKQPQQPSVTSSVPSKGEDGVLSKFAVYVSPIGRTEASQSASAGPSQGAPGSCDTLTPGLYYFTGEHLVSAPQESTGEYFQTGSDYVRVLSHGPEGDDDDRVDEDSSESEQEQDGVHVQSTLKGVSTLNINIQLNLADLLAPRSSRRRKKPRKPRRGIYEVCDMRTSPDAANDGGRSPRGPGPDRPPGVPGAGSRLENPEAAEHSFSLRDLSPARSHGLHSIESEPPTVPPKTYRSKSESDIRISTKDEEESSDVDSEGYEKFNNTGDQLDVNGTTESLEPETELRRFEHDGVSRRRRINSIPTKLEKAEWRNATELEEDPLYDKVTESVYECYSGDIKIREEVRRLESLASWFHLYNDRDNALKNVDANTEGSFVVIAENIEKKPLYPFTLYVKHKDSVKEIPIARTTDRGSKKYKILDEKPKKTIYDLITFYCKNPLPHFKIALKSSQNNKNASHQAANTANT